MARGSRAEELSYTSNLTKPDYVHDGKVTVKKGPYSIKIKVTAKGNANYKAGTKTVTCKAIVK